MTTEQNFNRMTILANGETCQVFKMKRERVGGYATDMAGQRFTWRRVKVARFTGTYSECQAFIEKNGAQFMTDHGIPC